MIYPEFRSGWLSSVCFSLDNFLNTFFAKYILVPVFITIPITLLSVIVSKRGYFNEVIGVKLDYNLQISIGLTLAVFLISGRLLRNFISEYSKPDSCIDRKELVAILDAINTVVSSKNKRFLAATKTALSSNWDVSRLFPEITKPDQQIVLLIHAVRGVFELLHNQKIDIKVGLMEVENGERLAGWFVFAPTEVPPKTGEKELSAPSSAIKRALEYGGIVVVESIQSELKKKRKEDRMCIKGSVVGSEDGSLITMPIYCPNIRRPIYVLSIKGDKGNCFLEKHKDKYKWILTNIFSARIILEHHLMLMKKGIMEGYGQES